MKENKVDLEKLLVGQKTEQRYMVYNWRDVVLYALAVGAKSEDMCYTYEKCLKAIPTFGTIPYWGTVNVRPYQWMPLPASMKAVDIIQPTISYLNMDHELILHRPIDAIKGTFQYQDEIVAVYDRGEDRGAVVKTKMIVRDEAGNDVCTNYSTTFFHEAGGFGGRPMPKREVVFPDRDPDFEMEDFISPVQNLLYRLTGDTNRVHVDSDYARKMGFDRAFMQGLCSYGYACRMLLEGFLKGEPERMTYMYAQMSSVLYPGTPVKIQAWKMSEGIIYFKFINMNSRKPVLNRGIFKYQPD